MSALVDTSCLLRLPVLTDPRRPVTMTALSRLTGMGETLTVARQNYIEFRSVATRPANVNGLGMTPVEADAELDTMEGLFLPLSDTNAVYEAWRDLCRRASVSGKQVHDTRIAAVCLVFGVSIILTWNPKDFKRFEPLIPGFKVMTPEEVMQLP
ncbi:MAG: type II toxin-antitoxin system VapC family toxin [Janthinobacterium lividum]